MWDPCSSRRDHSTPGSPAPIWSGCRSPHSGTERDRSSWLTSQDVKEANAKAHADESDYNRFLWWVRKCILTDRKTVRTQLNRPSLLLPEIPWIPGSSEVFLHPRLERIARNPPSTLCGSLKHLPSFYFLFFCKILDSFGLWILPSLNSFNG